MATVPITLGIPTSDFVTSTINGAITSSSTSFTIGAGLGLAAANGYLQIDYDSALALGADSGPESVTYTAYNSGTGALTGVTRGVNGTTAVAHVNGATIQGGMGVGYLNNVKDVINNIAAASWTTSPTGFSAFTDQSGHYLQIGKYVFASVSVVGTSNATGFTFLLPVAPAYSYRQFVLRGSDNGAALNPPVMMAFTASSTTCTVYPTGAAGNWTNVNSKGVEGWFFYESV